MRRTHLLHGIRVCSEVPVDAPAVNAGAPEVVVRWGARRRVPDAAPSGELLAATEVPGNSWLTVDETGLHLLRVARLCDFEFSAGLDSVKVELDDDAAEEAASMLLGGALATVMVLRGHCMLHASAIQWSAGDVIAFVGQSGTGKTTVAALCCAAGSRLVTDDTLRIERGDGAGWCFTGTSELRLRPQAADLAGQVGGGPTRRAVDGRVVARPAAAAPGRQPLAAIVAPVSVRGGSGLEIERLRGRQAIAELVRHPRTIGWLDPETARRDFGLLAELLQIVPMYRARVPWGPPFEAEWGVRLLSGIADRMSEPA